MTEPDGLILVRCTLNVRTAAHRRTPSDRYRDLLRSDTRMEYDELRTKPTEEGLWRRFRARTYASISTNLRDFNARTVCLSLHPCPSRAGTESAAPRQTKQRATWNMQRGTCNLQHGMMQRSRDSRGKPRQWLTAEPGSRPLDRAFVCVCVCVRGKMW
jgi:hypothetical protein